jgi:hypothetical protein
VPGSWDLTGLRGTGSFDWTVKDVFLPERRTMPQVGIPLENQWSPRIELLGAQHNRSGFTCGKESLDQYSPTTSHARCAAPSGDAFRYDHTGWCNWRLLSLSSTTLRLGDLPEMSPDDCRAIH